MGVFDDFWDPDFYEKEVGLGERVAELYASELGQGSGTVLDVGCGTGDVLLELVRNGWSVIGLDSSAGMIRTAQRRLSQEPDEVARRARFVEAPVQAGSWPGPLDRVIVPNDGVTFLLTIDELLDAFSRFRASLAPGGYVALDHTETRIGELAHIAGQGAGVSKVCGTYPYTDTQLVRVTQQASFDDAASRIVADFRYEILTRGGVMEKVYYRQLVMRPWRRDELLLALRGAGFTNVSVETRGSANCSPRTFIMARV